MHRSSLFRTARRLAACARPSSRSGLAAAACSDDDDNGTGPDHAAACSTRSSGWAIRS